MLRCFLIKIILFLSNINCCFAKNKLSVYKIHYIYKGLVLNSANQKKWAKNTYELILNKKCCGSMCTE